MKVKTIYSVLMIVVVLPSIVQLSSLENCLALWKSQRNLNCNIHKSCCKIISRMQNYLVQEKEKENFGDKNLFSNEVEDREIIYGTKNYQEQQQELHRLRLNTLTPPSSTTIQPQLETTPLTQGHMRQKPSSSHVGGSRRGITVKPNSSHNNQLNEWWENKNNHFEYDYNSSTCLKLKVPCRFVSDHICCRYKMAMDMVARGRAMDGSADLKWRIINRKKSKARSLKFNNFNDSVKYRENSKIRYNYSNSKYKVRIPFYHYQGFGPEVTSNLLSSCWRLSNINCSNHEKHPCCNLNKSPSGPLTLDRITRWLSNYN